MKTRKCFWLHTASHQLPFKYHVIPDVYKKIAGLINISVTFSIRVTFNCLCTNHLYRWFVHKPELANE